MQNTKKTNKYLVFGLIAFVLLFSAIVAMPARAEADFFDDFVDFLDPTQHIGNILDGRPQDNLPPIPFPDFSAEFFCNPRSQWPLSGNQR